MSLSIGPVVPGAVLRLRAQFHDDQMAAADPTSPTARHETPAGIFADLTGPAKVDGKTGYYGLSVDTTGWADGLHSVRIAGTVATGKVVATCYTILIDSRLAYLDYSIIAVAAVSYDAKVAAESGNEKLTAERLAKVDDLTFTVPGRVDAAVMDGTGSLDLTYRVLLDTDGDGTPDVPNVGIPGVSCVLTSDALGQVHVGSVKTSDARGYVTWRGLVAGTYYVWREHSAYTFGDPVEVAVE